LSDSCLRGSLPIGPMATTEENQLEQAVLCCVDPAVIPTVRKQVQPPFYLASLLECTHPHLLPTPVKALDFLESIKVAPNSWKFCLQYFMSRPNGYLPKKDFPF